jgi:benzoate membrane transport protein
MLRDFCAASITAGFVAVLTGFAGSAVIIFQAATAAGASAEQISSWLLALGVGMAVISIGLSLVYRQPILAAWSTPGAALLVSALQGFSIHEAVGAFIACGVLITLSGITGWFERIMDRIPRTLAAAMLAGILLQFGIAAFSSLANDLALVLPMLLVYLVCKQFMPRYAIVTILVLGVVLSIYHGDMNFSQIPLQLTRPEFITPVFSLTAFIGVALPLFIVTMTSQNIPGIATLRAAGYNAPVSPMITWSGITTTVLGAFGGYAFNLAAITAAICMGPDAHHDKAKRYTASVAAGVFYLLMGLFGATVTALFALFPESVILTLAGLALLSTIGTSLVNALQDASRREPALITFLMTASGVSILGVSSAFWGLVAGIVASLILRPKNPFTT